MDSLCVTVSGSFHRHISAIQDVVREFQEKGVEVLSPAEPQVVDRVGSFLFVASDRHRSIRLVEDRHLASILESDFLWLVTPDGYVGQSACLELGSAVAVGTPIYTNCLPPDPLLSQYICKVENIDQAIRMAKAGASIVDRSHSLLVDPTTAIETAHKKLDIVREKLDRTSNRDITESVVCEVEELQELIAIPSLRRR
jgi:hypothetical protein